MRIGTRGSRLACAQASEVAEMIAGAEIVPITTSGDVGRNRGEKSRWVDAIEQALLRGEIDLAVHSAKDLPGQMADGLTLLGSPPRAPAGDVICGVAGLEALSSGSRVGTSSLRRAAQLKAARADIEVVQLSGNVETRLRKLREQDELHAIVLAEAGLVRLHREDAIDGTLDEERFLPSPGQGALALQGRSGEREVAEVASSVSDESTFCCLRAERALAKALSASCRTPLAAHAVMSDRGILTLRAWVGLPDGSAWIADGLEGAAGEVEQLAERLAARMLSVGAAEMLEQAETMAD
jgi:hydroxymethylbilane synthase